MGIYRMQTALSLLDIRRAQNGNALPVRRLLPYLRQAAAFVILLAHVCGRCSAAVNVYAPNAQVQEEFIASATAQWNVSLLPSAYFPGTFTMNIQSKKVLPPSGQAACDLDKDISLMVAASTWTYVYGFANGQQYERGRDLNTIGNMAVTCSTETTCSEGLGNASSTIYQQNFADPTVIQTGL